jgi:hypothetical protein
LAFIIIMSDKGIFFPSPHSLILALYFLSLLNLLAIEFHQSPLFKADRQYISYLA